MADDGTADDTTIARSDVRPDGVPEGRLKATEPRPLQPRGDGVLDDFAAWELLEATPDGLVVCDSQGVMTYANARLVALTGYDRGELLGRSVEMLVPELSRGRHRSLRLGFVAAPRTRMMGEGAQLDIRCRDGRTVPVEISLAPAQVAGVWMTAAGIRDVSAQRVDDRGRRRLLTLLDLVPDAVFVLDADLRFEYANRGAVSLLGYGREELLAMTALDVGPHLTQERSRRFVEELAAGAPGASATQEVVLRDRGGVDIRCELHIQLSQDHLDGARSLIAVARDVRDRRIAEHERARESELIALVSKVTTDVLVGASRVEDIYQTVIEGAARLFRAETAAIVLPDAVTGGFATVAAVGALSTHVVSAVSAHGDIAALLEHDMLAEHARLAFPELPHHGREHGRPRIGPIAVTCFHGASPDGGLILVARTNGERLFTPPEVDRLARLARQVTLAVELGRARLDQQRVAVLEDRQRIARDLHDTVIQDMIAVGMQLNWGLKDQADPERRQRDVHLIDQLEETIRQLRGSVFEMRIHTAGRILSHTIETTLAESSRTLGHRPTLTLLGPVDDLDPIVAEQLVPALREALSNVARHAHATATDVTVTVDDRVVALIVEDNGRGLPDRPRLGTGISNLQQRAAAFAGTSTLTAGSHGGTRLRWDAHTMPRRRPERAPDLPVDHG